MKFTALLVASAAASAAAVSIEQDPDFAAFQTFMVTYNRNYNNQAEVAGRFAIFKDNLKLIAERNSDGGKDVHAVNKFADLHPNEFASMYLGTRLSGKDHSANIKKFNASEIVKAPANIDWRTLGAITRTY